MQFEESGVSLLEAVFDIPPQEADMLRKMLRHLGWCSFPERKARTPAMRETSEKQKAFARLAFRGMNQREAYYQVYDRGE